MTIWGNHSVTQYPDLFHAEVDGKNAYELVGDHAWVDGTYIPTVAKRGAAIIEARGASSAASAANAAVDHIRSWALGTPEGDWVSMAIVSDGSYGVPEGLISSFPCACKDGEYSIVQGLDIDDYSPRQDRRLDRRARRGARRRQGARPDLIAAAPVVVSPDDTRPVHRHRSPLEVARSEVGDGDLAGDLHHLVDAGLQLVVADPLAVARRRRSGR